MDLTIKHIIGIIGWNKRVGIPINYYMLCTTILREDHNIVIQ